MSGRVWYLLFAILSAAVIAGSGSCGLCQCPYGYENNLEKKVRKGISVNEFQDLAYLNKARMEKKNALEKIVRKSGFAAGYTAYHIKKLDHERKYAAYAIDQAVKTARENKERALQLNNKLLYWLKRLFQ